MPGLYIHIPYCRQACNYCNFHFSVSHKTRTDFIAALKKEFFLTKDFFPRSDNSFRIHLDTLYFGGGTPSILTTEELADILDTLNKYYDFDNHSEISIEANPDDLTLVKAREIKELGFNRLSIGIQSFFEEDLTYMNRLHNPAQAKESIVNSRNAGFENITIDLIYGTPTLQDDNWLQNLESAKNFDIPHISAYALTIEEKTPLSVFIKKGISKPVSDETSARQFEIMLDWMEKNNYIHYEISNFGKKDFFSRHNISYWTGEAYLGLGPSAHSFVPGKRFWNISNTNQYIESIKTGTLPHEAETLSVSQQINEYIMTSLRTIWGCNLQRIRDEFGETYYDLVKSSSNKFLSKGLLLLQDSHLTLTKKGKFLADGIAADLFVD